MIGQISGNVIELNGSEILVDVAGVGYELTCTRELLSRAVISEKLTISVHTHVREDEIRLFGFIDRGERQLFLLLTRVNGLGPRSSLDVISQVDRKTLLRAIGSGDVVALTAVKGIGKKKAERIVVELKDIVLKVASEIQSQSTDANEADSNPALSVHGQNYEEALKALVVLGFTKKEAENACLLAVRQSSDIVHDTGALVREALRTL